MDIMSEFIEEMEPQRSKSDEKIKASRGAIWYSEFDPSCYGNVALLEDLLDNKPLFTRTLLKKAAKDVEQARDPNGWDSTIVIPHVRGRGSLTVKIPDRYCPRDLEFSHAFDTSRLYGACAPYFICTDRDGTKVASEHTLKPDEPQHPLRQLIARSPDPPRMQEMQALEAESLASSFWEALKRNTHGAQPAPHEPASFRLCHIQLSLPTLRKHESWIQKEGDSHHLVRSWIRAF
jgi:hypothetical protein